MSKFIQSLRRGIPSGDNQQTRDLQDKIFTGIEDIRLLSIVAVFVGAGIVGLVIHAVCL